MGAAKDYELRRWEEEMGQSNLEWSQVKALLRWLMLEFAPGAVTSSVVDAIVKRKGEAALGVDWSDVRQMLNNLGEIYFFDLDLVDLYGQIEHMSDRFDSLADKVEQAREDAEFREAMERD